jgi:multimeric flavodoxin WrbA
MHEIYPRWVAAHGIMIVTRVHWYQVPSVFGLMMDRSFVLPVEIRIRPARMEKIRKKQKRWS